MVDGQTDRQTEGERERGQAAGSELCWPALSSVSSLGIPLLPGHVIRPAQEVAACSASARDPAWDRRRWRRRSESAVIFSFSSLQGLS